MPNLKYWQGADHFERSKLFWTPRCAPQTTNAPRSFFARLDTGGEVGDEMRGPSHWFGDVLNMRGPTPSFDSSRPHFSTRSSSWSVPTQSALLFFGFRASYASNQPRCAGVFRTGSPIIFAWPSRARASKNIRCIGGGRAWMSRSKTLAPPRFWRVFLASRA